MEQYVTKIRTESGDLQIDYNALANLPTTDSTLTVSGQAADAQAVGKNINNLSDGINQLSDNMNQLSDNINQLSGNIDESAAKLLEDITKNQNDISTISNNVTQLAEEIEKKNIFSNLKDAGIDSFPTTMKIVAETVPNNCIIVVDARTVNGADEELSKETISDIGNKEQGTLFIIKGTDQHRVTMMLMYGYTEATTAGYAFGNYAYTSNTVNWGANEKMSNGCVTRTYTNRKTTEWVNPPMLYGKTYLMTERWQGNPVYTKVINFGNLPNATTKVVKTDIGSSTFVCSFEGYAMTDAGAIMKFPIIWNSGTVAGTAYINNSGNIVVATMKDLSKYNAWFVVKYESLDYMEDVFEAMVNNEHLMYVYRYLAEVRAGTKEMYKFATTDSAFEFILANSVIMPAVVFIGDVDNGHIAYIVTHETDWNAVQVKDESGDPIKLEDIVFDENDIVEDQFDDGE